MFDISDLFIQCNKDSCCEHITVGVNIYIYDYSCASLLLTEFAVCHCVLVCVISNQSTSKKPQVSGLSELDTLCMKQGPKDRHV